MLESEAASARQAKALQPVGAATNEESPAGETVLAATKHWALDHQLEEERLTAVAVTSADLPERYPTSLSPDGLQRCDCAWQLLEQLSVMPDVVLSWSQLDLDDQTLTQLMGRAWSKLYPDGRVGECVPRKTAALIRTAL